jgi:RNA polymerase sigma-70 factor (ECF subfamily)
VVSRRRSFLNKAQAAALIAAVGSRGASVSEIEAVYRESFGRFIHAAAVILGDEALAADAVQEAFASAVKSRKTFRGDVRLEGWIWRIVINAALQQRKQRLPVDAEPEGWIIAGGNGEPAEDLAVRRWVAVLSERQRLVVFLRYFADLDYRGIAAALDVEVGTVSATLAAAHSALRRSVEEVER